MANSTAEMGESKKVTQADEASGKGQVKLADAAKEMVASQDIFEPRTEESKSTNEVPIQRYGELGAVKTAAVEVDGLKETT